MSSIFFNHNAMKLEINKRKNRGKLRNAWRLNAYMLFSWVKEEIKKHLETNINENKICQNVWDAAKAVLRGKFVAINAYIKKEEGSQINNLTL